jgi:RNA polymerase sigma-70 factor (ECF subfamily)
VARERIPRGQSTGAAAPVDEAAFRGLYEAELPYVLRSLQRLGVPVADLEDVAHDVFVVVYRRWADLDRARPPRPWLFGIAYRTAARALERRWRSAEVPASGAELGQAPETASAGGEARDLLLRALAALDLEHRVVCVMHDLDGQAAPEIAASLGIPVNTVYSRLRVGRQRLAAAVRALNGAQP